jgi:hypothetical protein
MSAQTRPTTIPEPVRKSPVLAAVVLVVGIIALSIWANLSFTVKKPADYRFFPPFIPNVNRNMNDHLGGVKVLILLWAIDRTLAIPIENNLVAVPGFQGSRVK